MKKLNLVLAIILVIMIGIFFLISHNVSTNSRDAVLKRDMKDYYEKYLKGKVIGVDTHQVSLEMLEKTNYDMKEFKGCNLGKSYSYIKIKSKEIIVENHLICDEK